MTSRRRPENIAFPRQVAMYLSRDHRQIAQLNRRGIRWARPWHRAARLPIGSRQDEVDTDVRQAVRYLQGQVSR